VVWNRDGSGLSNKRPVLQPMPPPAEPGLQALAQLGTMQIPVRPEAGRVKIDMFIGARTITMKGMVGEGNDRSFDANAPLDRSKAVVELDFMTGVGTVYVSPSCFVVGHTTCADAYGLSDDGDRATNQFAYRVDEAGIHLRYSFENAAPERLRQPFRWFAERQNPSIDGAISVVPDATTGWSNVSLVGRLDPFRALLHTSSGQMVEWEGFASFRRATLGVGALRDDQVEVDGICRQLPGGFSMGGW
jgi:hypothetical protein